MGLFIVLFFMIVSMIVGAALRSRFEAYSKIPLRSGLTGREVAQKMLRDNGIYDVQVTCIPGRLTDHYNPANKTVNLSPEVYDGRSISAAAVAAHECGHAVQHATAYPFLKFRSAMVPIVSISSKAINFVFIASMALAFGFRLISIDAMLWIIVLAQAAITLFSFVTLPVEFDATKRGLAWLNNTGLTQGEEHTKATKALRMAATTYVVAALASATMLLYYIMLLMGSRRND